MAPYLGPNSAARSCGSNCPSCWGSKTRNLSVPLFWGDDTLALYASSPDCNSCLLGVCWIKCRCPLAVAVLDHHKSGRQQLGAGETPVVLPRRIGHDHDSKASIAILVELAELARYDLCAILVTHSCFQAILRSKALNLFPEVGQYTTVRMGLLSHFNAPLISPALDA